MNIFLFVFIAFGITSIIVDGKIFEPVRNLAKKISDWLYFLLHCHQCVGFWSAVFLSVTLFSPTHHYINCEIPYNVFFDGCFGSGTTMILYALREKLFPDW